jgi:hypothetical protein
MTSIVDEGSSDRTRSTLDAWNIQESDFPKDGSLSEKIQLPTAICRLDPFWA